MNSLGNGDLGIDRSYSRGIRDLQGRLLELLTLMDIYLSLLITPQTKATGLHG